MCFSPVWDSQSAVKRKNARMFQRLATGNQIAFWKNEITRALTLTTSTERRYYRNKKGEIVERDIRRSWQVLRQTIKRVFGWSLNKYYAIRTSEGNGVYHIVFWGGKFIPQKWLSETWKKIHGASVVYIQIVEKKTVAGLTGYLLDRYLINQPIERISYGWGWAWLGFCKSWENVKLHYNQMRANAFKSSKDEWRWVGENHYVPFAKRVSNKAVCAWKRHLATSRKTSRQLRFFYESRGWMLQKFNMTFT